MKALARVVEGGASAILIDVALDTGRPKLCSGRGGGLAYHTSEAALVRCWKGGAPVKLETVFYEDASDQAPASFKSACEPLPMFVRRQPEPVELSLVASAAGGDDADSSVPETTFVKRSPLDEEPEDGGGRG